MFYDIDIKGLKLLKLGLSVFNIRFEENTCKFLSSLVNE